MPEWNYVEWAEKAAIGNLRERLVVAEALRQEANTLLTLLLAGIGGTLAYAFKAFEGGQVTPAACGAVVVALWFALISSMLMVKCVVTRPLPSLYNEPANIYKPDLGLSADQIRAFELQNIQSRIEQTKFRNATVAAWLDRGRLAAILTPVVFVAASWLIAMALGQPVVLAYR